MTTYIDYGPSPLHQGSRSRTGDQVDRQFVADLLRVLGDCRLLWLPNLTDTTTSTERSRHAGTITWSESLAAFDTRPARLGSGVAVAFNGTDEEGDVPDAGRYSFGDGAADQGFSVGALIRPDVVNTLMDIVEKGDSSVAQEWEFFIDASGRPVFTLEDESASAQIGRLRGTPLTAGNWVLLCGTYDGSVANTGVNIYVNAARVDDTDQSSGTYKAMENTIGAVNIGARYTTKARFFDGSIAFVFITAGVLGTDDVWTVKELANSYFGLSL